jgi:hypothetical protein
MPIRPLSVASVKAGLKPQGPVTVLSTEFAKEEHSQVQCQQYAHRNLLLALVMFTRMLYVVVVAYRTSHVKLVRTNSAEDVLTGHRPETSPPEAAQQAVL